MEEEPPLYLGFDFSTQQVKVAITDGTNEILYRESVHFDSELPEYRTCGGVIARPDEGTLRSSKSSSSKMSVTAPTIMWVKALDILMEKIRLLGVDLSRVKALSGAGQQHGSVFWRRGARETLKNADPQHFLHHELAQAFSILDSPVWMDSSTGKECRLLEERLPGGQETLRQITGSRAFERFTLNQLIKIYSEKNEAFNHTDRISLVSSFACSLFLGDYAPIDYSDAGGMNLFDINERKWSKQVTKASGISNLLSKLGDEPVPSGTILGSISAYMVERYGFDPDAKVVAFTGDNPSTFAGLMNMEEGDIGVSLGTSDTVFVSLKEPIPQTFGHVWLSPWATDENPSYIGLICYKNGSLTRERIRDSCSEGSWDIFSQLLDSTLRGNFGNIGIYFDTEEITPGPIKGDFRFNKAGERVTRYASKESEVRACIEGQFMAKRIHTEKMGYRKGSTNSRVWVTGGGSVNMALLQVLSDVFNLPVYTQGLDNSAAFGACYRALVSVEGKPDIDSKSLPIPACTPNKDANSIYNPMMEKYKAFEAKIFPS